MKKLLGILLLMVLIGCNPSQETIKIGVIGTLSGVGAFQGEQQIKGLNLALEEINQAGGINGKPVELIIEDSKTSPKEAVNALHKLLSIDEVKTVIGDSWSATTVTMVPVANEQEILLMSPLATLDQLSKDDFFFRTMPTTKDMMKQLAEHAYHNIGSRKVAILLQDNPFGEEHAKDFREEFELLGGKIVAEERFHLTQRDVRSQIQKIKVENPDTIFNLHATGPMMGLLMKQALELDVKVNWLGSFGAENGALVREYREEIEGIYYPYPYNPNTKSNASNKFVELYQEKYGESPNLNSANSYDALMIIANALKEEGEDPQKIKEHLLGVQNYPGVSGTITFDKNGDVKKSIRIKQIVKGEFVVLND